MPHLTNKWTEEEVRLGRMSPEVSTIIVQTSPPFDPCPWDTAGLFGGKYDGKWGVLDLRDGGHWRGDGSPGRCMLWRGTVVQARAYAMDLRWKHGDNYEHRRLPPELLARAMAEGDPDPYAWLREPKPITIDGKLAKLALGLCLMLVGCGGPPFEVGSVEQPALILPESGAPAADAADSGGKGGDADGGGEADSAAERGEEQAGEAGRPEATVEASLPDVVEACSLTTHSDGFGDSWQDCEPQGTHTQAEATAACISSLPRVDPDASPAVCQPYTCPTGSAICLNYSDVWACWVYSGPETGIAGAAHGADASVGCPVAGPAWN